MNNIGEVSERRLDLILKTSFLLSNEALFCLLYLLRDLNQSVTSHTFARDLGADPQLIGDQLQLLLGEQLVRSEAGRFRISDIGREVVEIAEQGVGNKPYVFSRASAAPSYSEIETNSLEAGSGGVAIISFNVLFDDIFSGPSIEVTDTLKTHDRAASAERTEVVSVPDPAAVARTARLIVDQYRHSVNFRRDAAAIHDHM